MWTMGGHALKDQGELDAAAGMFENAAELQPEDPRIRELEVLKQDPKAFPRGN